MVTTLPAAASAPYIWLSRRQRRRRMVFVNLADYLRRQFAYDEWANREVLAAIRATGSGNDRSLQLMSHILAARLPPTCAPADRPPLTPTSFTASARDCSSKPVHVKTDGLRLNGVSL